MLIYIQITTHHTSPDRNYALEILLTDGILSNQTLDPGSTEPLKYTGMNELKTVTKFKFSSALDQSILEHLYGDDLHYAASIFEIFIEYSLPDFRHLQVAAENSAWEEIRQLAHKLKPTFPMVGLTNLEEKLQVIEQNASQKMSYNVIVKNLEEVAETLENYIPILQSEYYRMREYLSME